MARKIILDWAEIQSIDLEDKRILALTDVSALIFMACSNLYNARENWRVGEEDPSDEEWDDISKAIGNAEAEIMSSLIGAILPHVRADIGGMKMLPCDGDIYQREDYPLLYAALHEEFIIDADSFRVPDLRDKFPLGSGDNYPIGTEGGEEEVLLEITHMPSHTHANPPHFHGEIAAIETVINGGLEAPAVAAIAAPSFTEDATIEIDETGGDTPHNNMPPFLSVRWAIVAG